MSDQLENQVNHVSKAEPCPVASTEQIPLTSAITPVIATPVTAPTIKVPVVLAEPTVQIVVESDITLTPAATEIKRVKKCILKSS